MDSIDKIIIVLTSVLLVLIAIALVTHIKEKK